MARYSEGYGTEVGRCVFVRTGDILSGVVEAMCLLMPMTHVAGGVRPVRSSARERCRCRRRGCRHQVNDSRSSHQICPPWTQNTNVTKKSAAGGYFLPH